MPLYDKFHFRPDPPQQPPTETADGCSKQVWRSKKLSTIINPPSLNILFHTSHQEKETRFIFALDPPQPPPVEIVDPILVGQNLKMFHEILVKHPVLMQPITVELSHFDLNAFSRHLDPPQAPPIQLEDNPGRAVSFRKKVSLKESLEDLMPYLCAHPSAELRTKTENLNSPFLYSSMSWLNPPQPPAMDLDDNFSRVIFREKQFNINKFVKSRITLTFVPPAVTSRHQATQHQQRLENVEMTHFFRLDSPQPPPLDIQDSIQKTASKIKSIHEPECLKAPALILQHSLCEETAKNEYDGVSLLKLDPPQPPPLHLEDNIQKPVFKIRTFSRISNVLQDPNNLCPQSPQIPIEISIDSPSLFRLSPPQPPLIEIEDSINCLTLLMKRWLDRDSMISQTPDCIIPTQIQEPAFLFHDGFQFPSTDLQRPQIEISDNANILLKSASKALEENCNVFSDCDVNVTVPWSPLITSSRKDLRRSPPSSPPTELADKLNSINFGQKNYYHEMKPAPVKFLQPQNHSDVLLLRNGNFLKNCNFLNGFKTLNKGHVILTVLFHSFHSSEGLNLKNVIFKI